MHMKKTLFVNGKEFCNLEAFFVRLLVVGQKRTVSLADLSMYELAPFPSSTIDDYGCLWKSCKSVLILKLGVEISLHITHPNIMFVDGNQLLYHLQSV